MSFLSEVNTAITGLESILTDLIGKDLTQPDVKQAVVNDVTHLLSQLGVNPVIDGKPLSAAVENDILNLIFDGSIILANKEQISAAIPDIVKAFTDFLEKN